MGVARFNLSKLIFDRGVSSDEVLFSRCTDGIVFVVDSVDVERMEEAKMELMRTAKCPDNQV